MISAMPKYQMKCKKHKNTTGRYKLPTYEIPTYNIDISELSVSIVVQNSFRFHQTLTNKHTLVKFLKKTLLTQDQILGGDLGMDAALDGVVGKAEKGAQPQQQGKSAKQVLGEPHPGGGL